MSALTMSSASYAPDSMGTAPQILSPLNGMTEVPEGEPVHLDVHVAPPGDLQVQWFKDGHPLNAGSRFNTVCDRGSISLDIIYTIPEDSGLYTCLIANPFGRVQTEGLMLNVLAEIDPNQDHQDPQWASKYEAASSMTREYERDQRNQPKETPQFVKQPVISRSDVLEGEAVLLEAHLATSNDATLNVEWLRDGQSIAMGSRFNSVVDRGLVILEISYCLKDDSGQYVCAASNALGTVTSNAVELRDSGDYNLAASDSGSTFHIYMDGLCMPKIRCIPEERVVTKSILDQASINHIRQLEEFGEEHSHYREVEVEGIPPSFVGTIEPSSIHLNEDDPVEFTVAVDCGNGSRVSVEWKHDDKLVKTSSRIAGKVEMGVATLKIHYTQPGDTGKYTCHVATEYGQTDSQPATLNCEASGSIITVSQLQGNQEKGLQAIEAIEAMLHAPRGDNFVEDGPHSTPEILRNLEPVGDVDEGSSVHFEIQIEPAIDPTLVVNWYKDDKLLTSGTRFRVSNDRGVAALHLLHTIEEDSGQYWCRVENAVGHVDSQHVPMNCHAGASVITQSNLLEGSEGYNLIRAIESTAIPPGEDYRYQEEEEQESKPNFDVGLQAATIGEGFPVRFLVRVSGYPTPKLTWYLNDEQIIPDSITKIFGDGAINYLEMTRCPALKGENKLHAIAENPLGHAEASTILTVVLAEDFRPDLKHVQPSNPFKRMIGLRKVDCSAELNKALARSKPTAQTIMEMERGTEMKVRMFRSPEVLEAEKMLDNLALNLRKSEIKRPTPVSNEQA